MMNTVSVGNPDLKRERREAVSRTKTRLELLSTFLRQEIETVQGDLSELQKSPEPPFRPADKVEVRFRFRVAQTGQSPATLWVFVADRWHPVATLPSAIEAAITAVELATLASSDLPAFRRVPSITIESVDDEPMNAMVVCQFERLTRPHNNGTVGWTPARGGNLRCIAKRFASRGGEL